MRKNAFTLIELLVVISIMSILTIITVSQFISARIRSRDVARKADLNSLSKALQNYYVDYGEFPAEDTIVWGGEFNDADYIYMKVVPQEKNSSMPDYCYALLGSDLDKFALLSGLENEDDEEYNKYDGPYTGCGKSGYNFVIFSSNAGKDDL
jgi:prepilin-type N-terminal cleavage/methylation domain-containing protein